MNQDSDHQLMLAIKEGQIYLLSTLYERYKRRLFGFFYHLSSDAASSEDLVHNVFIRIQKYKHSYHLDGNFESWIFNIARNVFHDHFRKNKRYKQEEDFVPYERLSILREEYNAEIRQIKKDEIQQMHQAIGKLSEENRTIIEMTKFQQMKYAEVAEILGLSESAVKVRIFRILKELRTYMETKSG